MMCLTRFEPVERVLTVFDPCMELGVIYWAAISLSPLPSAMISLFVPKSLASTLHDNKQTDRNEEKKNSHQLFIWPLIKSVVSKYSYTLSA